ncbi:hypothetical protein HHL08_19200 [Sphingobium sp. AR-3-1]|uniref:Uncharacterized protein n=1 Tax=Sphingobium psychrophilum TaxID=2728834 RepID=A0A7X9WYG7_9SPHN|nr:hypothetical protein [Sphingobium psychrophilum]NML12241.1 hypothetical protein [Sphingobium psychrophilum]
MTQPAPRPTMPTRAKRRIPVPGQSPAEDRMLAMIAALASELAVTRERLDSVERLLERANIVDRAAIETFTPDAAQSSDRDAIRRRLIAHIFGPLRSDADAQGDA